MTRSILVFILEEVQYHFILQHFETDDPEFFTTKISYIEQNDVEDMELTFSEEVYNDQGQLIKVRTAMQFDM